MSELSMYELETQCSEVLPEREALGIPVAITQHNMAVAANLAFKAEDVTQTITQGPQTNVATVDIG